MTERPKYRLAQKAFLGTRIYDVGTEYTTDELPGAHMVPLNDAAKARMEEFYSLEVEVLDKDFNPTGKFVKPNAQYRPAPRSSAPEEPQFDITKFAPKQGEDVGMSVAEAMLQRGTGFTLPPPAQGFDEPTEVEVTTPVLPAKKVA